MRLNLFPLILAIGCLSACTTLSKEEELFAGIDGMALHNGPMTEAELRGYLGLTDTHFDRDDLLSSGYCYKPKTGTVAVSLCAGQRTMHTGTVLQTMNLKLPEPVCLTKEHLRNVIGVAPEAIEGGTYAKDGRGGYKVIYQAKFAYETGVDRQTLIIFWDVDPCLASIEIFKVAGPMPSVEE